MFQISFVGPSFRSQRSNGRSNRGNDSFGAFGGGFGGFGGFGGGGFHDDPFFSGGFVFKTFYLLNML